MSSLILIPSLNEEIVNKQIYRCCHVYSRAKLHASKGDFIPLCNCVHILCKEWIIFSLDEHRNSLFLHLFGMYIGVKKMHHPTLILTK